MSVKTYDGRVVEPCTKYVTCRTGKSPETVCGECLRIGNPPEPVKVRIPRPSQAERRYYREHPL